MRGEMILHSDLNCFYASVEMNEHPELRGKAIAVCGSTENRHGIVLTASYPAKRMGVKTGMANWQARRACPDLIQVPPHYELYLKYAAMVRRIYRDYTDSVEPFGMDECWLSLPYCADGSKTALEVAEQIRARVKREIGITVSIGVSFSKILAKLGSDMKKPDGITLLDQESFRVRAWPLDVGELLTVGPRTRRKLYSMNIHTIGELARQDPEWLRKRFGVHGQQIWEFANGTDNLPVMPCEFVAPIKSVGHGATCVVDLTHECEVWRVIYELAQDVSHRLIKNKLTARGVSLFVKDKDLMLLQYNVDLDYVTQSPLVLAQAAFERFRLCYPWNKPVRALTITAVHLEGGRDEIQMDMFGDHLARERRRRLDETIDSIRNRFGARAIVPGTLMGDLKMAKDKCEIVTMPKPVYTGK